MPAQLTLPTYAETLTECLLDHQAQYRALTADLRTAIDAYRPSEYLHRIVELSVELDHLGQTIDGLLVAIGKASEPR